MIEFQCELTFFFFAICGLFNLILFIEIISITYYYHYLSLILGSISSKFILKSCSFACIKPIPLWTEVDPEVTSALSVRAIVASNVLVICGFTVTMGTRGSIPAVRLPLEIPPEAGVLECRIILVDASF